MNKTVKFILIGVMFLFVSCKAVRSVGEWAGIVDPKQEPNKEKVEKPKKESSWVINKSSDDKINIEKLLIWTTVLLGSALAVRFCFKKRKT